MKIIKDSSLVNLKDSVQLHPNRLFNCEPCQLNCTRSQVRKDSNGVYHCPRCDEQVTDITDTSTGQSIGTFLGF